jgi:hypothetical protein
MEGMQMDEGDARLLEPVTDPPSPFIPAYPTSSALENVYRRANPQ